MRSGAEHLFDVGDASLYRLPHLDPEVPDGPFPLPLPAPGARPFGLPQPGCTVTCLIPC
jgi:hypothetical protein